MDLYFYEDLIMVKTENHDIKRKDLQKLREKADCMTEIMPKAPDCVIDTVMKRINELDKQIKDYEDMLNNLEAEYLAHVNFLLGYTMNSPFEQRDLSHGSDDKD